MRCTATAPSTTCTATPCRETQSRASSWTRRGVRRGVFQSAPSAVRVGSDRASRLQGPRCRAMEPDDGFGEDDFSPTMTTTQQQQRPIRLMPVEYFVGRGETIADDIDSLFASLAQTRRGEMLFAEEMAKPDAEVCFVKAAGYVAMHRRPDLSRVDDALAEIDELAVELEKLLPPIAEGRFPLRTLKQISRFMFDPVEDGGLGFVGNGSDFYDPRNSCLDEVLATRKGIPITLSLIYMELARRVGVEMVGVNLPGRFMVRPVVHEMEVLVDCFNGGEILFVEDVEEMLGSFYGGGGGGDDSPETSSEKGTATPKTSITIDRGFFGDQTIRPRQFFTRVLTNLKQIYFNKEEYSNALLIVNYQQHCSPTDEVKRFNVRDGGICLFLLKRYNESAETLSGYLAECLAAETAEDESEKDKGKGKASPQAHAAKKLAAAKDRAQVSAMIETAQTQVKRLAVEKMVNQAVRGNGEEDEHMTDKSKKKNDQVPFEGDSFRIADEVSRRSTDEDDASDDESFGESN